MRVALVHTAPVRFEKMSMRSFRSESFLILPLFPIFLAGSFPFMLMGLLGFAGTAILGALMMSAALTVALDADTEFNAQRLSASFIDRADNFAQSSTRDAMVHFAKAIGVAGAALVAVSIIGLVIYG
jgi:branched-subunit amino acid transport protein